MSPVFLKSSLHPITLGLLGNHTSHAIHSSNPHDAFLSLEEFSFSQLEHSTQGLDSRTT